MSKILVADDDPDILRAVKTVLESRQYRVVTAATGDDAYRKAMFERPDLIILDVEMPDQDGLEVCQRIRLRSTTPILFLTVRMEDTDVVVGLKMGADDYLSKPFNDGVLLARVEAALRRETKYRSGPDSDRQIKVRDLIIDREAREVFRGERPVELTATEFKVLQFFAERTGRVVTRDMLLEHLWGNSLEVFSRTVDVHIGRLRRKLGDDVSSPQYIVTVPGAGYKMPA